MSTANCSPVLLPTKWRRGNLAARKLRNRHTTGRGREKQKGRQMSAEECAHGDRVLNGMGGEAGERRAPAAVRGRARRAADAPSCPNWCRFNSVPGVCAAGPTEPK